MAKMYKKLNGKYYETMDVEIPIEDIKFHIKQLEGELAQLKNTLQELDAVQEIAEK